MANVVDWLLDLFYLVAHKKTKKKRTTLAKIKAKAKKKNVIKNYVGRKPKSKK